MRSSSRLPSCWLPLGGLVLALASACQRVPEEPPPSPNRAGTANSATEMSTRCVQSTPASAAVTTIPPAASCPVDPEPAAAPLPKGTITFPDVPGGPRVTAEIARTSAEHAKGLMYRKSLAEDAAMLFAMPLRRVQEFWMRNTCIPLDLMFIDDDGFIVGIVENAVPMTEDLRSVDCPSRYVLEVNGGWSRRHGVRAGHHITLPEGLR